MRYIRTSAAKATQAEYGVAALHAEGERLVGATQTETGTRAIPGRLQDVNAASLTYQGTVDLTPEVIERLVAAGWSRSKIKDAVRRGARCLPSQNSLVYALPGMFD